MRTSAPICHNNNREPFLVPKNIQERSYTMNIVITGTNIDVTAGMRSKIEKKILKLSKFLPEDADVFVTARTVKDDKSVEVRIPMKGGKTVRAENKDQDFYAAVDLVEEKLKRQLKQIKEKYVQKRKMPGNIAAPEPETDVIIVREKTAELRIETVEEAAEEMELLDHTFHLFLLDDGGKSTPAVVYKRMNGGIGLIKGA